jgi:hypothetical protein
MNPYKLEQRGGCIRIDPETFKKIKMYFNLRKSLLYIMCFNIKVDIDSSINMLFFFVCFFF